MSDYDEILKRLDRIEGDVAKILLVVNYTLNKLKMTDLKGIYLKEDKNEKIYRGFWKGHT